MTQMLTSRRGRLSSTSECEQGAFKNAMIRVGRDYQAILPTFTSCPIKQSYIKCQPGPLSRKRNYKQHCDSDDRQGDLDDVELTEDPALCLWSPVKEQLEVDQLDKFIIESKTIYGYNEEQALALLMWHCQNIDRARFDLANFHPSADLWKRKERRKLFIALRTSNKNFNRTKKMFPDRSMRQVVQFYYLNKKRRSSLQDIGLYDQARGGLIRYPDNGHVGGVGSDAAGWSRGGTAGSGVVGWRRSLRGGQYADFIPGESWSKNKDDDKFALPRGFYYAHQEFVEFCQSGPSSMQEQTEAIDARILEAQMRLADVEKNTEAKKTTVLTGLDRLKPSENILKPTSRWTNEELQLTVQAVRMLGRDYPGIADALGSKTEAMIRAFFNSYSRRFKLDELVEEFEKGRLSTAVPTTAAGDDSSKREDEQQVDPASTMECDLEKVSSDVIVNEPKTGQSTSTAGVAPPVSMEDSFEDDKLIMDTSRSDSCQDEKGEAENQFETNVPSDIGAKEDVVVD